MIGMALGRSRAPRGWLAALVLGVAVLALGAAPALAAADAAPDHAAVTKKKDGIANKAGTLIDNSAKKKDGALDKDALSQSKSGLDAIKAPEIKTGDERKKP